MRKKYLAGRQVNLDLGGPRTWEQAVTSHKLAIHFANMISLQASHIASLALRLAWLYREKEMANEEQDMLRKAVESYKMEFLKEKMRASEYYKMDNFFTFIDEFCSDPEFQLSRIKFPVSYTKQQVTDKAEIDENTYYDDMDNIYIKEVPVDKSEWIILGRDAFTTFDWFRER